MNNSATEKIVPQPIGKGISVYTTRIHTFGTDAVLLASFARPSKREIACELGTGCGIISLIWCRDNLCRHIDAVDIQPDACGLVQTAVDDFSLSDRLTVHNADLRKSDNGLKNGYYSLVVMNPPYKPSNDGIKCEDERVAIARHEIKCTVSDAVAAACRLLNTGGRLCMCNRPSRLTDTVAAMRNNGIEPKRLRFVSQRSDCAPNLFLIDGKKGANNGLLIEKPLFIESNNGKISDEIKEIYGEYYLQKTKKD